MGPVENGQVDCKGNECKLKCEDNYHSYGGPQTVKCKRHTSDKGVSWTRQIGECKTCRDLNLSDMDEDIFEVRFFRDDFFLSTKSNRGNSIENEHEYKTDFDLKDEFLKNRIIIKVAELSKIANASLSYGKVFVKLLRKWDQPLVH